jgi:hypothetical protein
MTKTIWTSPIASQEIVDGPEVLLRPGKLTIRFSTEEGVWHELSFADVLKFTFTEFGASTSDHVDAYDKLLDLGTDSVFAREALEGVRRDVSALRHFRVFFDDVGAYDVIARSAEWS